MSTAKDITNGTLYAKDEVTSNNIIRMYKGDSFFGSLFLNKGTLVAPVQYVLTAEDEIFFGIAEVNHTFSNSIVRKIYTNTDLDEDNNVQITLTPDDTQFLLPGHYYYSVKIVTSHTEGAITTEEVTTVIPKTAFYLLD